MSKQNKDTLKEFIDTVTEKYKTDINAMNSFLLGYLSGFVENNMTPAMRKKMKAQTEWVKSNK